MVSTRLEPRSGKGSHARSLHYGMYHVPYSQYHILHEYSSEELESMLSVTNAQEVTTAVVQHYWFLLD